MKTIKLTVALIIGATLAMSGSLYSQWNQQGITGNLYGSGATGTGSLDWKSWGFGNFNYTSGNTPRARIHLNDFLLGQLLGMQLLEQEMWE